MIFFVSKVKIPSNIFKHGNDGGVAVLLLIIYFNLV